ncbi:MAG: hypothetical protein MSG64_05405 [Pyrinomonadaceae bacterium MAG19_C2-C3]|nr:hypothetical protein [Pyrinomonadaceae bacterium MAG19_C2-C3]
MLETARDLGDANYRALITLVPPHPSWEGELIQSDLTEGMIPVLQTIIRRTVGFPKAALAGKSIREIEDVRAKVAWEDYKSLGDEIREILKR